MKKVFSMLSLRLAMAVSSLAFLSAAAAVAQNNLLVNPGFETGDFSGWTVTTNSGNYGVNVNGFVIQGTDPQFGLITVIVHSGNYAAYTLVCNTFCDGPPYGMYLGLSQTFNLIPGDVYTAGFWLGNGSQDVLGNGSEVLVDGQPIRLTTFPYQLNPGYYDVSGSFIAPQDTSTITFIINGSGDAIAGFSADDFSLVHNTIMPGNGGYAFLLQRNNNKIASYQVNPANGALIPGTGSPFNTGDTPVAIAATGTLAYVADQGSSQISAYLVNFSIGTMTPIPGSPYAAPLVPGAVAVDNALHLVYATGLNSSGNGAISGWRYVPAFGALEPVVGSPFPAGTAPGGIAFDRSGVYAYVVDSANNALLAYSIDPSTGALTPVTGSPYPTGARPSAVLTDTVRNYLYVANAGDDNISGFQIGSAGTLSPLPSSPYPTGTTPVAMAFDSTQRFLYAANSGSNNIWAYQISSNGVLSVVPNSPFMTGAQLNSIASSQGFLFVTANGGISEFQINGNTGTLMPIPVLQFSGTAIATNGNSGSNPP